MIIFLASHMDAVAYTMVRPVRVISRKVTILTVGCVFLVRGDHSDPAFHLVYRCFAGTMKTTVVLTALPFLVILLVKSADLFAG